MVFLPSQLRFPVKLSHDDGISAALLPPLGVVLVCFDLLQRKERRQPPNEYINISRSLFVPFFLLLNKPLILLLVLAFS
jgi:hypothetical protein